MDSDTIHPYFRRYNRNPWNKNIPDCAIRATSLATNLPYVDVCRRLGVSFKNGHGLIRDSGIYLEKIKSAFDEYFDIVVDFSERLPDEDIPDIGDDTASIFDDDEEYDGENNSEMNLAEWMDLNAGTGNYIVGLHSPYSSGGAHLVFVSTRLMKFYDTWDCSQWKVDAWMRVKKREKSEK